MFARDEVISRLRDELRDVLATRPVMLAYLHGSVAEGYALPDSDVDIALVLASDHGLPPCERTLMELDIAAELEVRCGFGPMDVRSINDAPVMVHGTVLIKGVLLYSRDEDFRADYQTLALKRYYDFRPAARMFQQAYFERVGRELREQGLLPDGELRQNRESVSADG